MVVKDRMKASLSATASAALLFVGSGTAAGQTTDLTANRVPPSVAHETFPLSVSSIMRGPELVGESPVSVRWTDDGRWIYFRWRPGGSSWSEERATWRVATDEGEPERLSDAAADSLQVWHSGGDLSADRRFRIATVRGDLFLVDRAEMTVRRLTNTIDDESAPLFTVDGSKILYLADNNVFALGLRRGGITQLTDIRSGEEPEDEEEAEGQTGFLEDQQEQLFEHIRTQKAAEAREDSTKERRDAERPATLYIPDGEHVSLLRPSPGEGSVLLILREDAKDARQTQVPEWITESGYTEDREARVKVGDEQSRSRAGLIDVATGEATWLDLGPEDEVQSNEEGEASAERNELASIRFRGWNDAGTHALLFVVDYDYKAWRLYAAEGATGTLTLLDSASDSAWVGGPCFSCAGWLPDRNRAWYVSETTGWAHLYTVDADGSDRRQITSGEWEVRAVEIPEAGNGFVIHSSEGSPFDVAAWTLSLDGGTRTRRTAAEGRSTMTLSPAGDRAAIVRSTPNRPPELFVMDIGDETSMRRVTVSPTPEWVSFPWIVPEIIHFDAMDGARVPARVYRPRDLGASPNGAAVVFVHGAGYLQNVHNGWSSYYREYMFHHLLAAGGITVIDIDYRGSAGYGRDWRTGIYRWMGGLDLSDQVDGVDWLIASEGIDPARVGIYGGSYGGFITLMALFTEPDVFLSGAALRSVTDWAHYNHWYTSRILNQPQDDAESFERSSPIYFADGFRGHLLIAHGMEDSNVQFQDVVRLNQRLIELGKENWEMALYPIEPHGFVEPASWTDEYRRILELFSRTLVPAEAR